MSILTADVLVDRIFYNGRIGNLTDVLAENTTIAMMSLANAFEEQFFYGVDSGKEFKGLVPRIADGIGKQFNAELTMDNLDEALDYVSYGAGEKVIICNAKTRRTITKLMRASKMTATTVMAFGQSVIQYDGAIIYTSEAIKDGQVFFLNFEEATGVSGLTVGGLTAVDQGFEGTHHRTGVELIAGIKTPHPRCFAVLDFNQVAKARTK